MIPYRAGEPLTCQQIRELDVLAIEHVGIPGIVLMENAARSVAEIAFGALVNPALSPTCVLCGSGSNGGDGFVVARHLHNAGVPITVMLASAPDKLTGDARTNYDIVTRMGLPVLPADAAIERVSAALSKARCVIDALLGTGATGAPRGRVAELVDLANAAPLATRIAVDIPTGLDADDGTVHTPCFRADATVTFVAAKPGFAGAGATAVLGRVCVVDIGAPRELIPGQSSDRRAEAGTG